MKLELLLKRKQLLDFEVPPELFSTIKRFCSVGKEKHQDVYRVTISYPMKRRTTGKNSQNTRIAFLCNIIAAENAIEGATDYQSVKDLAKLRAIKRGYPYRWMKARMPDGSEIVSIVPKHEDEIDVIEAGYLIDELEQMLSELGIDIQDIEERFCIA